MANTRFTQFLYTKHAKPVILDVDIPIGATGAVGTLVGGSGISSVTRLAAGLYKVQFVDNYNKFLGMQACIFSPNSGSNVNDGSFSVGTTYIITAVGTTNWQTAGLPTGQTAAIGSVFKATAVGGAGSGTAKVQGVSGIANIEMLGSPTTTLYPTGLSGNPGGYVIFQTLAATSSSVTTLIATDPANGSTLSLEFYFSDSGLNALNNG